MKIAAILSLIFFTALTALAGEKPFLVLRTTPLIASMPTAVIAPRWSPDGKQIAFTTPGYKGLWLSAPDGKNIRQISDAPSAGFDFAWSPLSNQISYTVARFKKLRRENAVNVFNLDTQKQREISGFISGIPLSAQWLNNDDLLLAGKETRRAVLRQSAVAAPQHALVYIRDRKIFVEGSDDQTVRVLTPFPGKDYLNARLAPNGQKIVFEVMGGNLFVINTDGSGLTDLGLGYRPDWSPDSRYIVFMRTQDDGYTYSKSDLWIASPDGKTHQQLTHTDNELEMDPDWSPDGSKIIYDNLSDGKIYQLTIEEK